MSEQNVFTKAQLVEMWKRPVERQYNIAISKMLEAIIATEGDIRIAFSGGKDPAKVKFAFKPIAEGGAGFKEAIEYMNEHCGTKVIIPDVR